MLCRRQAIKALAGAALGTTAVGFYTWQVEPHWLELTHPLLPMRGLSKEIEGCTLAQISDLHIGPRVADEYIIESFRRVKEMIPDFVVFTGDWITYRGPKQFDQLRRVIAHVPHGRLGTVGILGNHDYGFNWRMLDVAEKVTEIVRNSGITLLRNEAAIVGGIQFMGIDDLWSPCFDPGDMLKEKSHDASTLVLCHNPDAADKSIWGLYQGWILAGHTHGGQCKSPFLPPPLLPVKNRRYVAGQIELTGSRRMYISRGVGHLLQVRFNVRPEIPVFRLQSSS